MKLVIHESESPQPTASSILISRMMYSLAFISYIDMIEVRIIYELFCWCEILMCYIGSINGHACTEIAWDLFSVLIQASHYKIFVVRRIRSDTIWIDGLSLRIVAYDYEWNRDPCDPPSHTIRQILAIVFSLCKTQSLWIF